MSAPRGLSRIALPVLEEVALAIERGRVEVPFSEVELADAGFRGLAGDLIAAIGSVDRGGALAAIRIAIAERLHRSPPRLDLVWTGPETRASVSRSTSLVVERLFAEARESVLVAGYAFDSPDILKSLHAGMRDRALSATFFLDIRHPNGEKDEGEALANKTVDRFFREVWTFGTPKPDVFYDPRTALRGPPWSSLHAKCIVVDDERALITSANFTDRAQTRNIEAGVLIEDHVFAGELAAQWRQLIREGLVQRYLG